jgi:flagellar hook-associated protein 1 FlgK
MANILGVGKSAIAAAHAGLVTTGHNIANVNTPGYSRQNVIQAAGSAQKVGAGYIGTGTVIMDVRRAYDDLLTGQVRSAQSAEASSAAYLGQIKLVDNMLGDGSSGLSPAIQDFFKSVQGLTSDPLNVATREQVLSQANTISSQFNGMSDQLSASRQSVNNGIVSSVSMINTYAKQISALNDTISRSVSAGETPNDLLDQRDQVITDLSKQIKVSVVSDGKAGFNVFIGNGQPLVVGTKTYELAPKNSLTEQGRMEVAYQGDSQSFILPESSLTGGALGGLFEYRSKTLDVVQASLGRMAMVFSQAFNDQNKLGLDPSGNPGKDVFGIAKPAITPSALNASTAQVSASIVDAKALTSSNYSMKYDGSGYTVTRLSDGSPTTLSSIPQIIDGISFGLQSGAPSAGDEFLIQPTLNGAAEIKVLTSDTRSLAIAGPLVSSANIQNSGSGKIGGIVVDASYMQAPLSAAINLSFTAGASPGSGTLSGFPDGSTVSYISGEEISYGGIKFTISGSPNSGDAFAISPNTAGAKDGSNAIALAAIQSRALIDGQATVSGSYAQIVSSVGNKTRELSSTNSADKKILDQSIESQQSVSGVNLDEEAANLMKYQQAYQAAGKLMQAASAMFDVILSLRG